jgi:hypothetical protein
MPQSKRQKHVFLIYAHSDKKAVRQLYQRLVRHGINTWLDEVKLLPGHNWKHEIHQAILSSRVVIVCVSKQFSKQGGYRHEEIKIALAKARSIPDDEVFLIPVRLEKCDLPGPVRQWQCVDLFERDGFNRLLSALKESVLLE